MPLFRRADGDYVPDVPNYRRILPFIMRTRTESNVLFEQHIDAGPALAFIHRWNADHPEERISFMHLVVHAIVQTLHERPRLNRFVMGSRLYQRRGIWVSFSAKKAFNDNSPVVAFKQQFDPAQSFAGLTTQLREAVMGGKSDKESHVDKELKLFLRIPAPILRFLVKVLFWLDAWNLLPHFFFADDPLYSSVFIANLGSIRLDAAYHHNFEYGNIPIFVTIGTRNDVPFVKPDGTLGCRKEITLRWTYDERIEDGFYCAQSLEKIRERLEAPERFLGASTPEPKALAS
jgi:hypothetical protein